MGQRRKRQTHPNRVRRIRPQDVLAFAKLCGFPVEEIRDCVLTQDENCDYFYKVDLHRPVKFWAITVGYATPAASEAMSIGEVIYYTHHLKPSADADWCKELIERMQTGVVKNAV